ncbi:MAG TPA: HPr family phosphocarrier protein [Croceibacterium sp.]|jgi:phosphocarrier protein|nr:HPr family phosphocarrier protein [Croceibacterium sp.]
MAEARQTVTITNKRGLHARASAKFVAAAAQMDGTRITVTKDGASALGGSILGLMMLGAAKGDTIEIAAEGEDAEARLGELVTLVESGFGED